MRARLERGQRERNVLAVPGAFFGVPDGLRVAWGLPDDRLDEALRRLGQVLDQP